MYSLFAGPSVSATVKPQSTVDEAPREVLAERNSNSPIKNIPIVVVKKPSEPVKPFLQTEQRPVLVYSLKRFAYCDMK